MGKVLKYLQKNKLTRKLIYLGGKKRAQGMLKEIESYLVDGQRIIDMGAGACNLEEILLKRGFDITPVDVENISFVDGIEPTLYDGSKLPFKDSEFDTALILTVLHHTKNPVQIIQEAMRVANNIIIIEDVYETTFQKHKTFFLDSLINLEFAGHPHSNKTHSEWLQVFDDLGLTLVDSKAKGTYVSIAQRVYFLKQT